MAISNPAHPNKFSILHKKNILWIKDSEGKKATVKIDADYKQWTVKGSKGNEYLVIRQKGQYNCSCPGLIRGTTIAFLPFCNTSVIVL